LTIFGKIVRNIRKESNVRNLTKALTAIALLAPSTSYSLGVGGIKLYSSLNQKLRAEIALVISKADGEDIEDIKVALAPPEKFDTAGVKWNYFLSKIKFKTKQKANGAVVIQLSSSEALTEPFLDFLIEVNWPAGNIYKEFTVLVDPPTTYAKSVAPIKIDQPSSKPAYVERLSPPSKTTQPFIAEIPDTIADSDTLIVENLSRQKANYKKLPAIAQQKSSYLFDKDGAIKKIPVAFKPKKVPITFKPKKIKQSISKVTQKYNSKKPRKKSVKIAKLPRSKTGTQYGPTAPNTSLSRIATETNRYADISPQQMMLAIYKANPHAFYQKNVNALSAGKFLTIPSRNTILRISRHQAITEFKQHNNQWKGIVSTRIKKPTRIKQKPRSHLALIAPDEANISKKTPIATSEKLHKPSDKSATKLANANQDLKIRLKKLQERLKKVSEIIVLKDKQLALLNRKLSTNSTKENPEIKAEQQKIDQELAQTNAKIKAKEAEAKDKNKADTELKAKAVEDTELKAKADEATKIKADTELKAKAVEDAEAKADTELKAKADEATKIKADNELKAKADEATEAKAMRDATYNANADLAIETAKKPLAELKTEIESDKSIKAVDDLAIIEPSDPDILSNPYYLSVAGGGSLFLILFGWMFLRKRKLQDATEVESMFTESSEINLPDDNKEDGDEFGVENLDDNSLFMLGGESSFMSDSTEFDAFDVEQGDVDPISEADVYIAYGRYQQAEELMRQAIENHPNRDENKCKLLEILAANDDKEGFEKYVEELANKGKNTEGDFWKKVSEIGQKIIPDSPLLAFSNVNNPELPTKNDVAEIASGEIDSTQLVQEKTDDFESNISNQRDIDQPEADEEQILPNNKVALSKFDEEPLTPVNVAVDEQDSVENKVDFDLSEFDEESLTPANVAVDEQDSVKNKVDSDLLEFDDLLVPTTNKADSDLSDSTLDETDITDTNDLEKFDLSEFDNKNIELPELNNSLSFFNSDNDNSGAIDPQQNVDNLDKMSVETKIDLANSYMDMGDANAAKTIIEEILVEGTEEQKVIAQKLMQRL
jgi:pilus assembly protein FimV